MAMHGEIGSLVEVICGDIKLLQKRLFTIGKQKLKLEWETITLVTIPWNCTYTLSFKFILYISNFTTHLLHIKSIILHIEVLFVIIPTYHDLRNNL